MNDAEMTDLHLIKKELTDLGFDKQEIQSYSNMMSRPGYHNCRHVAFMLRFLQNDDTHSIFDYVKFRTILVLAILFHDYAYTPGSDQNERDSAFLMRLVLERQRLGISISDIELAQQAIIDAPHVSTDTLYTHQDLKSMSPQDNVTTLLHDLDYAILGSEFAVDYMRYCSGIYEEYGPKCKDIYEYNSGRLEFLEAVMKRKHVFCWEFMENRYGDRAMGNMMRECQWISPTRYKVNLHNQLFDVLEFAKENGMHEVCDIIKIQIQG